MNIQIIGTKKCRNTQKAVRFFQERSIHYYFVDLNERTLSKGEFEKITAKIKPEDLVDSDSQYYQKNGYAYREYDASEELFEHQELLRTPIVRNQNEVSCGFAPEIWKAWRE